MKIRNYIPKKTQFFFCFFALILLVGFLPNRIIADETIEEEEVSKRIIERKVKLFMENNSIPSCGIAVVFKSGFTVLFGLGDQKSKDTVYKIGSISKTFCAFIIMKLHERGELDIEDDINDYLNFTITNPKSIDIPIKIKHLLSHLSGIRDANPIYGPEEYFSYINSSQESEMYHYPNIFSTLLKNTSDFRNDYFEAPTNRRHIYTNLGYDLLAYIAELANREGLSYPDLVKKYILDPLDMDNTKLSYKDYDDPSKLVELYVDGELYNKYDLDGRGSCGWYSTIEDLARFLVVQMNEGVSKYKANERLITLNSFYKMRIKYSFPQYSLVEAYGYGWQYYPFGIQGHSGHVYGSNCWMIYLGPVGLIFFLNHENDIINGHGSTTLEFIEEILRIVREAGNPAIFTAFIPLITIALVITRRKRNKLD